MTWVARLSTWRAALPAVLLLAFAVLLAVVELRWGPVHRLDLRTARSLHRTAIDDPNQTRWWRWVSDGLSPTVLRVVALVAVIVLWLRGRRRTAVFVAVAVVGAATLELVTKVIVGRARPVFSDPVAHAAGGSFPSGHAMTSLTVFGVAVIMAGRRRRETVAVAVLAVAAVGFSRMALGVHYLSDVLGGWLLGTAWLLAVDWFFNGRTTDGAA
ncbi:MAG: phosphatase PAP2 family protein [Jatrophihabitans sp.]|uniref:phosphatase PAP2 family protein n=1 Tax=Jatrophihabitans sp. TaxID=1932789 RepID=UPI0039140FFE